MVKRIMPLICPNCKEKIEGNAGFKGLKCEGIFQKKDPYPYSTSSPTPKFKETKTVEKWLWVYYCKKCGYIIHSVSEYDMLF